MQFPKKSLFKRFSLNFRAILIALTVERKRCIIPILSIAYYAESQRNKLKERRSNNKNSAILTAHSKRDF